MFHVLGGPCRGASKGFKTGKYDQTCFCTIGSGSNMEDGMEGCETSGRKELRKQCDSTEMKNKEQW